MSAIRMLDGELVSWAAWDRQESGLFRVEFDHMVPADSQRSPRSQVTLTESDWDEAILDGEVDYSDPPVLSFPVYGFPGETRRSSLGDWLASVISLSPDLPKQLTVRAVTRFDANQVEQIPLPYGIQQLNFSPAWHGRDTVASWFQQEGSPQIVSSEGVNSRSCRAPGELGQEVSTVYVPVVDAAVGTEDFLGSCEKIWLDRPGCLWGFTHPDYLDEEMPGIDRFWRQMGGSPPWPQTCFWDDNVSLTLNSLCYTDMVRISPYLSNFAPAKTFVPVQNSWAARVARTLFESSFLSAKAVQAFDPSQLEPLRQAIWPIRILASQVGPPQVRTVSRERWCSGGGGTFYGEKQLRSFETETTVASFALQGIQVASPVWLETPKTTRHWVDYRPSLGGQPEANLSIRGLASAVRMLGEGGEVTFSRQLGRRDLTRPIDELAEVDNDLEDDSEVQTFQDAINAVGLVPLIDDSGCVSVRWNPETAKRSWKGRCQVRRDRSALPKSRSNRERQQRSPLFGRYSWGAVAQKLAWDVSVPSLWCGGPVKWKLPDLPTASLAQSWAAAAVMIHVYHVLEGPSAWARNDQLRGMVLAMHQDPVWAAQQLLRRDCPVALVCWLWRQQRWITPEGHWQQPQLTARESRASDGLFIRSPRRFDLAILVWGEKASAGDAEARAEAAFKAMIQKLADKAAEKSRQQRQRGRERAAKEAKRARKAFRKKGVRHRGSKSRPEEVLS